MKMKLKCDQIHTLNTLNRISIQEIQYIFIHFLFQIFALALAHHFPLHIDRGLDTVLFSFHSFSSWIMTYSYWR